MRRAAFRALFKVPKDSELGFVNARARSRCAVVKLGDVENVKRRKLIETTTLGVGALALEGPIAALLEILEISEPPPIPRRVGANDIAQIRSDPLQAATLGHEALDLADAIRSHHAAEELRELHRYAATHRHLEEVEHLRHRIATLLCTQNP